MKHLIRAAAFLFGMGIALPSFAQSTPAALTLTGDICATWIEVGSVSWCVPALQRAYNICEKHIASQCDVKTHTCYSSCASRPGAEFCAGAYEWPECEGIAKRWISSPEYQKFIDLQASELKKADDRDRAIVVMESKKE
jgi:hypothetical protein